MEGGSNQNAFRRGIRLDRSARARAAPPDGLTPPGSSRITRRDVSALITFTQAAELHGYPASTLTDNGMVYTVRLAGHGRQGGKNAFEAELSRRHIVQKNSRPNHPTTCGKGRAVPADDEEMAAHPAPPTIDHRPTAKAPRAVPRRYNHRRPHRSLPHRATPSTAYQARPKATPGTKPDNDTHDRVRHDKISKAGTVTLRVAGQLRHIGVGRTYAGTYVILLVQDLAVRVVHAATGEAPPRAHHRPTPRLPTHRHTTRTRQKELARTYEHVGPGYSDVLRHHIVGYLHMGLTGGFSSVRAQPSRA